MKIRIERVTGPEKVDALIVPGVPGLAVTKGVGSNAALYAVTHTHSGLFVLHCLTQDDALTTMMDLALLGDWDVPANKLSRSLMKRVEAMKADRSVSRALYPAPKDHPAWSRRLPR